MSAAQALAYAQAHMPPFTAEQIAILQNIANDEAQLGGMPLQVPIWFHNTMEDIENPENDFEDDLWQPEDDWQPPQQEDPEGVAQSPANAPAGGDPEEEEENPRQFRGQGDRITFREEDHHPKGRVGRF